MSDPKINNRKVSLEGWEKFQEIVTDIYGEETSSIFEDQNVTAKEIDSFLDANHDGKVRPNDFKKIKASQFSKLTQVLAKHGFHLGQKLGQSVRFVKNFTSGSFPKYLWSVKGFVLAVVKQYGDALCYADPSLRKDREIVLAAVKGYGSALEFADPSLRKDRAFILAAVKQNGDALCYADPSLKKDKEIVLAAVKQASYALQYADPSLKKDKEIVLAAVKQNGYVFQFADPSLKKDKEIVLAAVKQNGYALEFADPSLQKDPEILRAATRWR